MKKPLFLILGLLSWHSILAQNDSNSSPITTPGISLPQLITTNINRSNLQFGVNLSDGYEQPHLSVNYEKFISDESKQLKITSNGFLSQTLSLRNNDNRDFYKINALSFQLGANLKLFNKNDYFIEFGTNNTMGKPGGIFDFDFVNFGHSLEFAIGKGRIDYVNDGAAAMAITEKLSEYGLLNRELTKEEYFELVQRIEDLKNRRRFVNRSYPLTETEEIQDLLATFGVIDQDQDVIAIIDDAYKYEPMIDRTTGSQFRLGVSGSYYHNNSIFDLNNKGLAGSISYSIHSAINSNWQYNKSIEGYAVLLEPRADDPRYQDSNLRQLGIRINNDIHYLLDNRIRLSLLTSAGYNFVNKLESFDPIGNPFFEDKGFYLNTRSEVEFQISRTMSTEFGIDLNISKHNTFTGLRMGLNF